MRKIYGFIRIIGISSGFVFSLIFFIMFYMMLFTGVTNILLIFNEFGEFWFEFILINIIFCIVLITFIIECIKPSKGGEKREWEK